jgi:hypothetical protein
MSLFTHEEVCRDCVHSHWVDGSWFWDKQPRFSRCDQNAENDVDAVSGECRTKVVITPSEDEEK